MKNLTYEEFINNILETRGRFACGDEYHERHHIVPRCMDGGDDEENLIDLFAREHFEAHRLLALENPDNEKLAYAWSMMAFIKSDNQYRYELSPSEYEEIKTTISNIRSERYSGEQNPMYGVHRYGADNPNYGNRYSEETRLKISIAASNRSEETRKKMSESMKKRFSDPQNCPTYGWSPSDETRKKMSESAKARCTEEWKRNLSEQKKELFANPENHPFYGRHHSEETKEKLRECNLGKTASDDTKQKLSKLFSGGNNPRARKIIRLSDLIIYDYLNKAAQENDMDKTTMRKYCLQHKDFMYYDEWLIQQNDLAGDIVEKDIKSEN